MGRVQTPTLAMLVERELAIRALRPRGLPGSGRDVPPAGTREADTYEGTWFRDATPNGGADKSRRSGDAAAAGRRRGEADRRARARRARRAIESIEAETQRMPPPLLYDLTELQRHANRLFGFSAQKTLDIAQALYEQHKLISYPRTDSRHLSQDVAATLPTIVAAIEGAVPRQARARHRRAPARAAASWTTPRSPTTTRSSPPTTPRRAPLSPTTSARSTIWSAGGCSSAWHDDHIWSRDHGDHRDLAIRGDRCDRYHTLAARAVQQVGWKVLDIAPRRAKKETAKAERGRRGEQALPPGSRRGSRRT